VYLPAPEAVSIIVGLEFIADSDAIVDSYIRLLCARGLSIRAAMITSPSITITTEYVTPAITSNSGLKTSERSENTPPRRSMVMNIVDIPMTSLCL